MKHMKTHLVAAIGASILSFSAVAQIAPKYSNEFLAIGVGARALGMSGAAVASVNDVTAGYWNPAALLRVNSNMQLGLQHAEYFASIAKYDYLGWTGRIDSASALGVSVIRFGVDDIPNTTQLIDAGGNIDYDRITFFSAQDYAFLLSYARKMPITGLNVGGNFKIIRRTVGDFAGAWGFGLDASATYDYKGWKLAAVVRDVTSTFNAWSVDLNDETKAVFEQTGNEIPGNSLELTLPRMILGAARSWDIGKFSVGGEVNLVNTFDGKRNTLIHSRPWSLEPLVGFEAGFKNTIFFRAGIGNIQKSTDILGKKITTMQPNMGVGLKFKAFTIDYALTDIGDQSVALYSNIFSLKIDINKHSTP